MKNKKGFTLVELLAVIVIMAILALIAIPITISIISNSRENAHKESIKTYGREIEKALVEAKIDKKNATKISELKDYIKTSGEKVKCDDDQIYINDGNNQLQANIDYDNIYLKSCYVIDDEEQPKSKKYDYIGGKLKEIKSDDNNQESSGSYREYSISDKPIQDKTNGEDYYVIADKGDYVVALKAKPLTVDEVNEYGQGHINKYLNYSTNSAQYINGYGGMTYYSNETCGYNGYSFNWDNCSTNYDNSDIRYVVNNWAKVKFGNELEEVNNYKARLLLLDELLNFYTNCDIDNDLIDNRCSLEDQTFKWIYSEDYWYWTMSSILDSDKEVIAILENGYLSNTLINYNPGVVRPVINLRKEFIK